MKNGNILLYGQPGTGKSTLAQLIKNDIGSLTETKLMIVDGDEIRAIAGNTLYDREGRQRNTEFAISLTKYLNSQGLSVIIAMVLPYRSQRQQMQEALPGLYPIHLYYDKQHITRERQHYWDPNFEIDDLHYSINTGILSELVCKSLITNKYIHHVRDAKDTSITF